MGLAQAIPRGLDRVPCSLVVDASVEGSENAIVEIVPKRRATTGLAHHRGDRSHRRRGYEPSGLGYDPNLGWDMAKGIRDRLGELLDGYHLVVIRCRETTSNV